MEYKTGNNLNDINENMCRLVDVLNHRVTKLEVNVMWLKRLSTAQVSLLAAIFLAMMATIWRLQI